MSVLQTSNLRAPRCRVLIRTVPWHEERLAWAKALQKQIPTSELILDEERSGYATMIGALRAQGEDDAWHLEDDAILTSRWVAKADWLYGSHGKTVIQGYSDRRDDVERGSHYRSARTFVNNQCFFVPGAFAQPMADAMEARTEPRPGDIRVHYDVEMREWLHPRRYWQAVPSLVQHRESVSLVDPRRSSRRRSRTFVP